MSASCRQFQATLTPFLYPALYQPFSVCIRTRIYSSPAEVASRNNRSYSTSTATTAPQTGDVEDAGSESPVDHLNPPPEDYARSIFTDRCSLSLHAGAGGHGCISFLREKFVAAGPANGGDGGSGGSIYIQAVRGETSLHKLARRGIMKAGRGKNGRGKNRGGERGEDLLISVPVGTVLREISRLDPVAEEEERIKRANGMAMEDDYDAEGEDGEGQGQGPVEDLSWRRDKFLLHPASAPSDFFSMEFPRLRSRQSPLGFAQPEAPIHLDLSEPMEKPMLLVAGAVGGLGNPHFVSNSIPRPKFATKGETGVRVNLQLELKILADVGLVGLPNAGKSTLLRAVSRSRTRVGNWAFTTLQPNIGTVVLDNHMGRPRLRSGRTNFTIADIPGLIPDAHLDRGLGLGFLRHVERARALAFVVDLGAGDAVAALKALWTEVAAYERLRDRALNAETERRTLWKPMDLVTPSAAAAAAADFEHHSAAVVSQDGSTSLLPELTMPPISAKPWFVIATKADLAGARENFAGLQAYLDGVAAGMVPHPAGKKNGWRKRLVVVPVSAIRGEGVDRIVELTVGLLDEFE
ncbi:MAG: hypothetical protein M1819_003518 [Sarea resinae]|nr:MAG: hypothetical protein M1819_003518 [Sarea resinae]